MFFHETDIDYVPYVSVIVPTGGSVTEGNIVKTGDFYQYTIVVTGGGAGTVTKTIELSNISRNNAGGEPNQKPAGGIEVIVELSGSEKGRAKMRYEDAEYNDGSGGH